MKNVFFISSVLLMFTIGFSSCSAEESSLDQGNFELDQNEYMIGSRSTDEDESNNEIDELVDEIMELATNLDGDQQLEVTFEDDLIIKNIVDIDADIVPGTEYPLTPWGILKAVVHATKIAKLIGCCKLIIVNSVIHVVAC